MRTGLLWFSLDAKPLGAHIAEAARRYAAKFGVTPNHAFVNPDDFAGHDPAQDPAGIVVTPKATVLKRHVWIGVDEALAASA